LDGTNYTPFYDKAFLEVWDALSAAIAEENLSGGMKEREARDISPLKMMAVTEVDYTGIILLYFNKDLIVPSIFDDDGWPKKPSNETEEELIPELDFEAISETVVEEEVVEKSAYQKAMEGKSRRMLQNATAENATAENATTENITEPVLDINQYISFKMFPGSFDSASGNELAFNTTLTRFQKKILTIKLDFENPLDVSKGSQRLDMLEIKVTDESLFVDRQNGMPLEKHTKHIAQVKPQIGSETVAKVLEALGTTIESTMSLIFFTNVLITLCLATSLKRMWALMLTLQLLVYTYVFAQYFPAHVTIVFLYLDSAINGKFLHEIFSWMLSSFSDVVPYAGGIEERIALDELSLESVSISQNTTGLLVVFIFICLLATFFLAAKISLKYSPKLQKAYEYLKEKMFYNLFIRYMIMSDLKMLHLSFAYFTLSKVFRTGWNSFFLSVSLAGYIIFAIFVFFCLFHMWHTEGLRDRFMKLKYGSIWQGLRIDSKQAVAYYVIFCIRRFWVVILATQFTDKWF